MWEDGKVTKKKWRGSGAFAKSYMPSAEPRRKQKPCRCFWNTSLGLRKLGGRTSLRPGGLAGTAGFLMLLVGSCGLDGNMPLLAGTIVLAGLGMCYADYKDNWEGGD